MINVTQHTDRERTHIISDLLPDLTPLLDVMFMLIIFLVLTTNSVPHVFDIILPEDKEHITQAEKDPNAIHVTIPANADNWTLSETPYTNFASFSHTLKTLHQKNPDQHIIIYGDKNVTMEKLLKLLTFMRKYDIPTADIVMQQ